ncbi:MAG TPA: metal-dependent transcriptional regulator [Phycisphaerae bacterium]|nr:metal-dependent transcriptional regulator [Phycisphaerae bacterium]HPU26468.1 metal-dependent transcriptional regulator [Phycisphaerae bacterium]
MPNPPDNLRSDRASASVEDYIKAVYRLQAEHGRATTRDLSQALGVQMASVTGMMKQLHAAGYVDHKPYQGVELTPSGETLALRVLRRHRLLELFLHRTLGIAWDEVHEDAERLEHAVSERLIAKIDAFLGEPVFDPHGAPIPQSDGTVPELQGRLLSDCPPGHCGQVLQVSDKDPALLRHLADLGIRIGLQVRVLDQAPFGGPVRLQAAGRQIDLGRQAAERVLVSVGSCEP